MQFQEINLNASLLRSIEEMGYEQMTPIQEQAIPVLLEGKDILGQAQTGTGKTAAFGIPVIESIDPEVEGVQAIILCPTRELAIQTAAEIRKLSKYVQGVKVLPIYGGQDITMQIRSLKGRIPIVVGTPGRVMDHMRRNTLKLEDLHTLVLDEADEMLNMGFREDIETILAGVPEDHRTALFSATMPKAILDIVNQYQRDAVHIKITPKEITIPTVKQYYYEVPRTSKQDVVARLLDYYNPKLSLVFCNTKKMVEELTESLKGRGYFAEGLHGDMSQYQRDKVMNSFRNGSATILVATDVAARGIDVDDVEAVFNFDIPQDPEYYVHRIGRTGRAGRKGRSFTLVAGRDIYKIRDLEKVCNTKMKARAVPSVADVSAVKAEKALSSVFDILHEENQDLTRELALIEQKLNDEECSAMELAAAFLKQQMGKDEQEIPTVERYGRRDRDGRRGDGRGYRGNREGGRGEGRGYRDDRDGGRRGEGRGYRDDRDGGRKSEGRGYRDDRDGGRRGEGRGDRDNRDGGRSEGNRRGGYREDRQGGSDNRRGGYSQDRQSGRDDRKKIPVIDEIFGGRKKDADKDYKKSDRDYKKSDRDYKKSDKKSDKIDVRRDGSAAPKKKKSERSMSFSEYAKNKKF